MELHELIGKTVLNVDDLWEAEFEDSEIRLYFEDGTELVVSAVDSAYGYGGDPKILVEVVQRL